MRDPRLSIIGTRLKAIRRILLFAGAKGGVGKSTCTALAALALSRQGSNCGVFDLDFQGSSIHLLLGMDPDLPDEDRGLLPRMAAPGVHVMSMSFFTGERSLPFRGAQTTDALKELLAVTLWPDIDLLLIDMPPGMGDELLDLIRFIPRIEPIIVLTPSLLSIKVAARLARLLADSGVPALGIIANMASAQDNMAERLSAEPDLAVLPLFGKIPICSDLERGTGSPDALLQGEFSGHMATVLSVLMSR